MAHWDKHRLWFFQGETSKDTNQRRRPNHEPQGRLDQHQASRWEQRCHQPSGRLYNCLPNWGHQCHHNHGDREPQPGNQGSWEPQSGGAKSTRAVKEQNNRSFFSFFSDIHFDSIHFHCSVFYSFHLSFWCLNCVVNCDVWVYAIFIQMVWAILTMRCLFQFGTVWKGVSV